MKKYLTLFICFLICYSPLHSQKKNLDHNVYDTWENIGQSYISPSGNIIFYTVNKQEGDNKLEVKDKENNLILQLERSSQAKLFDNEKYFVSLIKPFHEAVKKEKQKPKKDRKTLRDSLYIYNLDTKEHFIFSNISSYKTALYDDHLIAFTTEHDEDADSTENRKKTDELKTLHIVDLNSMDSVQIENVDDYAWSFHEKHLVYTVKTHPKDSVKKHINGLYLFDKESFSSTKIKSEKADYRSFTFDDKDEKLVFLADTSHKDALLQNYQVYCYTSTMDSASVLITKDYPGVPENWYIQKEGSLYFSESGKKLYLGISPIPEVPDTSLIEDDHAKVDIWHWEDDYIQPYQLVNRKKELEKSFPAVYDFNKESLMPLADEKADQVSFGDSGDGEWALVKSDYGNRIPSQWEYITRQNIGLISVETGDTLHIVDNFNGSAVLSPQANHVVLFDRDDGNWKSYSVKSNELSVLNEGIPTSFVNEDHDMPALPNSYGISAWSEDGQYVAINDKYDVWLFHLDGKKNSLLTQGYGRKNQLIFRYLDVRRKKNIRRKSKTIDLKKSIHLTAFDEISKKNGLYLVASKNKNPKKIFLEPFTYKKINSSKNDNILIYTKESYEESPNLFVYKENTETPLSKINPQQENYTWGTAELVQWTTPKGYAAEGILYKPEDFDPHKKYPVIAYFYERLSQGLYTYHPPAPTPSRLNISYFVSNGYLVFAPDIRYETGYPGQSAEEYVNSGMKNLAKNPWVDEHKMGIQGQSWGGYQVAHLITRTDLYAAAWAGAPVVNMTSAYGGIRWKTGMSRQFQYEQTQSRIGKTLWEGFDLYIENSPLFHFENVNTPVAVMHNDNDGAVPWYQGIEMFTALRRLNKPVWLLNYNNDEHNLMKRQNRKDIQRREAQFFDHFLKGKPAAPWIEKGVPATEKGIDWGF